MTRDLCVHFQFEFTESVLEVQRDLVKVDREMGAKMVVLSSITSPCHLPSPSRCW